MTDYTGSLPLDGGVEVLAPPSIFVVSVGSTQHLRSSNRENNITVCFHDIALRHVMAKGIALYMAWLLSLCTILFTVYLSQEISSNNVCQRLPVYLASQSFW